MNSQYCWHPLDIRQFYIMQYRIEPEELTYEDEPSNNASLTINKLENAFEQNQNQIEMMEKFIKSKTSEIATLQEYLIGEFQNMENAKDRNKRIEKILVTQAIPALKGISASLRKFKDYLSPFASVATAYITALASKSQEMLAGKQATIDQQARTIQQLQQKLDSFSKNSKEEQWHKTKGHNEFKFQESSQTGKGNYCVKNDIYLIDHKVHKVQKEISPAHQSLTKITYQKERPNEMSKSPQKATKYEQCYQNILENKKFINYRCERPLSPLQMNGDLHRKHDKNKQDFALGYERKQCIKQKIEKIKIRTECKQKQTKFAFYDNNH